jgi:hypothetical protein
VIAGSVCGRVYLEVHNGLAGTSRNPIGKLE